MSLSHDELTALARELPADVPSADRLEQVRTAILASVAERPPRRRSWLRPMLFAAALGAASAAFAVGLHALVVRGRPGAQNGVAAQTYRAQIFPHPGASFVRAWPSPDEIVRLTEGTITVEVSRLGPGERFRVITGDGEIEVRGTAFDVSAAGDRLAAVRVMTGRVRIRSGANATTEIGPGERWQARLLAAGAPAAAPPENSPASAPTVAVAHLLAGGRSPAPVAPPPPPRNVPGPSSRTAGPAPDRDPSAPPRATRAVETLYDEAWGELRAGRAGPAAATFERAALAAAGTPLAEDATFWQGVALRRAGRRAPAGRVLVAFIERYPRSPRASEAAAILGWLLLDDGDLAGAERRLTAAARDPVPKVRDSARAGLAELSRRRASGARSAPPELQPSGP
ncbi:MAG: FecR domain-containing protein [Deltaproteobacteria bacterium]|nr:FecR domain-containing protein [Deltaproteobacteria bacterium]